ncbi:MAG: helix-turn-helix domain-containing protein [Candidatus Pacearchaeota archaeon]
MEIDKELVRRIKEKFGLNVYESKVWLALISKGMASSSEISSISDVPRSRTYDVLESLEKKGFAIAKIGKPTKYIAVEPITVLEKLKNNAQKEAEEKITMIESLKMSKEYRELENLHNSATSLIKKEDLSSVLRGRANIFTHFKTILNKAKKNVVICVPAWEIKEKPRNFKEIFSKIKERRLPSKVLIYGSDEDIQEINKEFGINAKKISIKTSFLIVDDKTMFILSEKINEDTLGVWINSEFFTNSLNSLVERIS